jgi:hypothetical protein
MADGQRRYRSYLLRVWQAGDGDAPEWRISLEDVVTHERHSFAQLGSMCAFFEALLAGGNRSEPDDLAKGPTST